MQSVVLVVALYYVRRSMIIADETFFYGNMDSHDSKELVYYSRLIVSKRPSQHNWYRERINYV